MRAAERVFPKLLQGAISSNLAKSPHAGGGLARAPAVRVADKSPCLWPSVVPHVGRVQRSLSFLHYHNLSRKISRNLAKSPAISNLTKSTSPQYYCISSVGLHGPVRSTYDPASRHSFAVLDGAAFLSFDH